MENQSIRLVPDYELPPYAFLPGYAPHPERDPEGHMRGYREAAEPSPTPLDPDLWKQNRTYLVGLDLFNNGYYWEAHEKWEALWLLATDGLGAASFLKGLIKLAAAGVKIRVGNERGIRNHAAKGYRLFHFVAEKTGRDKYAGLWLPELKTLSEWIRDNSGTFRAEPELEREIVFEMILWPEEV